jgi:hypothetical protein
MRSDFRRFGFPPRVAWSRRGATITVKLELSLLSRGSVTMQVAVIAVQRPDKNGLDKPLRPGQ